MIKNFTAKLKSFLDAEAGGIVPANESLRTLLEDATLHILATVPSEE
jgi:hypothetical protein